MPENQQEKSKKVFVVHGHKGYPNGAWRTWLMSELEKQAIYACALPMPNNNSPLCQEWVGEIQRQVEINQNDSLYFVGHSLGSAAILRFLENNLGLKIAAAVLVSTPITKTSVPEINNFFTENFNFNQIKSNCNSFVVIHGDNDYIVPIQEAVTLSKTLDCKHITVPQGGHLSGSEGFHTLPQVLDSLLEIMKEK